VFVITDLITRGFFFKTLTENEPERRREYAFRIAAAVAIILGISAVAGREILDIIGINLGAFGAAGGLVVVLMGIRNAVRRRAESGPGWRGSSRGA
jgi:multiple antibiotic resistance protein